MTCHAVEIVCSPTQKSNPSTVPTPEPSGGDYAKAIAERVAMNVKGAFKYTLPAQDQEASIVDDGALSDAPKHVRGRYRFDGSEGKTALLDALESDVLADAEWYVVRHHNCKHADGGSCPSFTDERTAGTVPSGV